MNDLNPNITDSAELQDDNLEAQPDDINFEELLSEIRDDEQEVLEENTDNKIIEIDEDSLLPAEKLTDNAWTGIAVINTDRVTGKNYVEDIKYTTADTRKEEFDKAKAYFKKNYSQVKHEYAVEAMNQNIIDLSSKIPVKQVQFLISLLTAPLHRTKELNSNFINRTIKNLLMARMPRCVKNAFRYHPQTIQTCKGFLYRASEEYGQSKTFWATPDIPYFHKQGTEMDYLMTNYGHCLQYIDRGIVRYSKVVERLDYKEVRYAATLAKVLKKGTYLELVQYNAIWFHILFEELKKELTDDPKFLKNTGI